LEKENEYVFIGTLRLIQFLFFWSLYELLLFAKQAQPIIILIAIVPLI
jgi:hypothetical protein